MSTEMTVYQSLAPEHAAVAMRAEERIKARTVVTVIENGRDLLEVKNALGHGLFTQWLAQTFPFAEQAGVILPSLATAYLSENNAKGVGEQVEAQRASGIWQRIEAGQERAFDVVEMVSAGAWGGRLDLRPAARRRRCRRQLAVTHSADARLGLGPLPRGSIRFPPRARFLETPSPCLRSSRQNPRSSRPRSRC